MHSPERRRRFEGLLRDTAKVQNAKKRREEFEEKQAEKKERKKEKKEKRGMEVEGERESTRTRTEGSFAVGGSSGSGDPVPPVGGRDEGMDIGRSPKS